MYYERLREGAVARTVPASDDMLVDVDGDGLVLGVEVLDGGDWRDALAQLARAGRLAVPPPAGRTASPGETWVVVIEDRHADPGVWPFSTEEAAVAYARRYAGSLQDVEWDAQLNPAMIDGGWVLYLPYGSEGDSLYVIRRAMDGEPQ